MFDATWQARDWYVKATGKGTFAFVQCDTKEQVLQRVSEFRSEGLTVRIEDRIGMRFRNRISKSDGIPTISARAKGELFPSSRLPPQPHSRLIAVGELDAGYSFYWPDSFSDGKAAAASRVAPSAP